MRFGIIGAADVLQPLTQGVAKFTTGKRRECSTLNGSDGECGFHSNLFGLCGENGKLLRNFSEVVFGNDCVTLQNVSSNYTGEIPPACLEVAKKHLFPFSCRGVLVNIVKDGKFAEDQSEIAEFFEEEDGLELDPVWFLGIKDMDGIVCYSRREKDDTFVAYYPFMNVTLEDINESVMNLLEVKLTKEKIETKTLDAQVDLSWLFKAEQVSIVSLKEFAGLFKGSHNLKFSVGNLKKASPSDGMCETIYLGKVDFKEGVNINDMFKINGGVKSYLNFSNGVIIGLIVLGLVIASGMYYSFVMKKEKKDGDKLNTFI